MTKTVRQVCKLLVDNGFEFIGIKGDHRKYFKQGIGIIIVPGRLGDDLADGTYNSILRKAGLK